MLFARCREPATVGVGAGSLPSAARRVFIRVAVPLGFAHTACRDVFTLDTDLGRIDLLAEVAGLGDWTEIRKCCVRVPAFGREGLTLDLPSLIRAKRAARRTKDLLVLPELESLLEAANVSSGDAE